MTIQEKIALASSQVEQAKLMLNMARKDVIGWENILDLRAETLERLQEQVVPIQNKPSRNGKQS